MYDNIIEKLESWLVELDARAIAQQNRLEHATMRLKNIKEEQQFVTDVLNVAKIEKEQQNG